MLEKVFGKTLKQIRTERRLSQEKLAELCELDRTYISLLERGLRQPTLSTLFKLLEALEIEPDDFIKRIKHE